MSYYQKQTRARQWHCKCGHAAAPSKWDIETEHGDDSRAECPECSESYPVAGPLTGVA